MKRTKKDAMKNSQKNTPTNTSDRPRFASYESQNSMGLPNNNGNNSSAGSNEEQDMNKSQKSQEKAPQQQQPDEAMEMNFENAIDSANFISGTAPQN